MYSNNLKPTLDFVTAFICLLILSPLFLLTIILLSIANYGRPFFFQKRPGRKEHIFTVIKFKTMNDCKDAEGELLPDEQRLTWIGAMVRKTSLDEIPQLLNVLKGEMSFVGPRPLLTEYLPLYDEFQKRRHEVKPGITGWAQVNGRNAISWEDKFKLDVWYVDHQSFWLDLKILFMTIVKVFKAEGISAQNHVTVEKFEGSR